MQRPRVIRTFGEPIGNTDLSTDLAGGHGDAGLLTGGDDFLEAELAVAENGDKSNEHGGLSLVMMARSRQLMQSSCHYSQIPYSSGDSQAPKLAFAIVD